MDHHVQYPAFDVSPFASPEPFGWAAKRGHSSAGRALAWHARGRRFDPAWLHHASPFGLRVAQPRVARRTKRGARRSPKGEDGLVVGIPLAPTSVGTDVVRLHHLQHRISRSGIHG